MKSKAPLVLFSLTLVVCNIGHFILDSTCDLKSRIVELRLSSSISVALILPLRDDKGIPDPRPFPRLPSAIDQGSLSSTDGLQLSSPPTNIVHPLHELEQKNRSIMLVHVGKSGGLTLRSSTAASCKSRIRGVSMSTLRRDERSFQKFQNCTSAKFTTEQALALQVQTFIHMNFTNLPEFQNDTAEATTYLLPLRNPVDRIVSAFRYSHPANCPHGKIKDVAPSPWSCTLHRWRDFNDTTTFRHQIWQQCFPTAAMEDFAQSVMSPYSDEPFQQNTSRLLANTTKWNCRNWARQLVQGVETRGPEPYSVSKLGAAPHMGYNLQFYTERSLDLYPEKEVLGIRTTHEWTDMVALDQQLGGSGNFTKPGRKISHGSETYQPSPLTTQAYQKLCCVLKDEIAIYRRVVDRVANLDDAAKQEEKDIIKRKCGIVTSWEEWSLACEQRMEEDTRVLENHLNQTSVTGGMEASNITSNS